MGPVIDGSLVPDWRSMQLRLEIRDGILTLFFGLGAIYRREDTSLMKFLFSA